MYDSPVFPLVVLAGVAVVAFVWGFASNLGAYLAYTWVNRDDDDEITIEPLEDDEEEDDE